jgi:hypothetical protein
MLLNEMTALRVGGALHFVQIPAMIALAGTIKRYQLDARVPAPLRKILVVLGGGIVLSVLAGGVLALQLRAEDLTTAFGLTFVASWAVFWAYRLAAQLFIYGPLIPQGGRWAHWSLSAVLLVKTLAYAIVLVGFVAHYV